MAASTLSKRDAFSTTSWAPAAALIASGFGQPSRGATMRSSDRPQFNMARADIPMFAPSCGRTRMIAGPGTIRFSLLRSVPAMIQTGL